MEVSSQLHTLATLPTTETTSGTHRIGGWVGPKASLDSVEYRKISCPRQELYPRCPVYSPLLYLLSYNGNDYDKYNLFGCNVRVIWKKFTNASVECTASIFRREGDTDWGQGRNSD
jgi:hypothetical protein